MRIIAGIHRGRRLKVPKNLPVRPTTDRAREALFSILNHKFDFANIRILDLYAGTGSISYEFCSRGANQVTAIDKHGSCVRFINQTARELEMSVQAHQTESIRFLETCHDPYDIIFADPPYAETKEIFKNLVSKIFSKELLTSDGLFVLEHGEQLDFSNEQFFVEQRKYGGCVFAFFEIKN